MEGANGFASAWPVWPSVATEREAQECVVAPQGRQWARQPVGVTWTVRRRPQSPQKRGGS